VDHRPRSVEALVEQQVRRWEAAARRRPTEVKRWPVVTVSREFGARGAEVGRAVAERLGFTFWDKELVGAIAAEAKVAEHFVAALDERRKNAATAIFNAFVKNASVSDTTYLERLLKIVQTVGQRGSAVIVGRGGHLALGDDDALRVRIVGSPGYRAESLARRYGWTLDEAQARMAEVDAERRAFMLHHFHRTCDEPHDFDLVLRVDGLSVDALTEIIVTAYELRFGKVPRPGAR